MDEAIGMGLQIEEATRRFVDELVGLDEATWNAPPLVGPWCLSEVLEHVTIANQNILAWLQRSLEPISAAPSITDDEMPYLFYSGEEPLNVATPTGTWTEVDEGIERLRTSADMLIAWAHSTPTDLRSTGAAHPVFGLLDGAQWLRFSAVHTWRHRTQVRAVRNALSM